MSLRNRSLSNGKSILGMESHEITACASLAAISAAMQIVHPITGWRSPWGMWIDIVAIPWLLAYFLYGGRPAFVVSVVGAIIITLIAPSTWLGAMMKWLATLPMFLIPVVMQRTGRLKVKDFRRPPLLVMAIVAAVLLRGMITIPVNYYFAIPIWTGMTPAGAMSLIPWWIIFGMNAIQGAIEVVVAWLLVFMFRLDRFATWR